jgi:hypothetical protein
VQVRIHQQDIPEGFANGDYLDDQVFRDEFRAWAHGIWQDKDQEIARLSLESAHAEPN